MTASNREYFNHQLELRNDFYNRGNYEAAEKITKKLDKLYEEVK